ncbi:hypothetical protein ACFWJ4_22905, partial [Kitasatospora sp. NPDC127067]|uniref:hypothetical protein n=1 Tax=Kitasatospora sp. NPDC127067 TaxID=3347126 RepID=UPI00365C0B1D
MMDTGEDTTGERMTRDENAGQTGVPQERVPQSPCPIAVSSDPGISSPGSIDPSEETGRASVSNRISGGVVHGNVIQGGVVHIHPGPVRGNAINSGRQLGKPIGEWDAHDLEVHPAGAVREGTGRRDGRHVGDMPGYVRRAHDQELAEAVRDVTEGRSRMVVLVGSSSTGKTRACWEAVQPLAEEGWRLWHPHDPTRAEAMLADLDRVAPRTVVWLNEAQHYLGHLQEGERIAAAVHTLLTHPDRGPVLVLGTLWPEYANAYTVLPRPGGPDPHSRVRELLAGHTLTIPDTFDQNALRAAITLARDGDQLMADTLTRALTHGRVTQDLAGAPELLRRYQQGSPAIKAVLEAAMDARRFGVGPGLPQTFLTDAATDYLTEHDYDQLTDDWAESAFADLAHPVHGKQALLRRTTTRPAHRPPGVAELATMPAPTSNPVLRLADYIEQHGRITRRRLCPPASFWYAAHTHLTHPDDLNNLATAADDRHRLQWAHHLRHRAAKFGHLTVLSAPVHVAAEREDTEALVLRAANAGRQSALIVLAWMREKAGERESAETLARQAADAGSPGALIVLAWMREKAGERESAETLARQAADAGSPGALIVLAWMREKAGRRESAETLARQAADAGHPHAVAHLAWIQEGAEERVRRAAEAGRPDALARLAWIREDAGDQEGAEELARQAADAGHSDALAYLAWLRLEAGDWDAAETLYWRAANADRADALARLAWIRQDAEIRERSEDGESAEEQAQRAADAGYPDALARLAWIREDAGDQEGAEELARQAADAGH